MSDRRVGLIGCGRIGRSGHLEAYRKFGVPVAAVCDLDQARARAAAAQIGIDEAHVFTDAKQLADCEEVELIDVATPPHRRTELLLGLLAARKPLLVQKPVAYASSLAERVLEEARRCGVPVAVNHNARWAPVQSRLTELIRSGALGTIVAVTHLNRFNEDLKTWYTDHPDYLFLDHGLHYIDLVRWHTGLDPTSVSALAKRLPNQTAVCPLLYAVQFRFASQAPPLVSLLFNNAAPAGAFTCDWFIDGSEGSAHATLESIYLSAKEENLVEHPGDHWVPDGFHGAYRAFVDALDRDEVPPHSLDDHLRSLRAAEAAAASARLCGEWVTIGTGGGLC